MSFRYMRVIIFFDLPTITSKDRREYLHFRKFLINEGFIMMQESIYSKIVLNSTAANLTMKKVRKNKTTGGVIQAMIVTEKQYSSIEYINGEDNKKVLDNTSRMVIL